MSSSKPTLSRAVERRCLTNSTGPLPPSQDPFYTAPPAFETMKPGTVLRIRSVPGNLTSVIGNCSAAYHILYRTTNALFQPSWAVTTLYIPEHSAGKSLLSYQYPYNSPDLDHSPSYDFYFEPSGDVGEALGLGLYVSVPDHEGPLAADGATLGQGLATLDSVRAVLSIGFGLSSNARYAMWGYSGGALASEWAAELQEQYAPELNFSGTALGGTPPNITNVWDSVNGTPFAGMIALASIGVTQQFPDAHKYLISQLKPEGEYNRTTYMSAAKMGAYEGFATFAGQDMWDYFINGRAVLGAPVIQRVLDDNFYMSYHGVPKMQLFMYHAIHDQVARIELTDNLVARYCGVHTNIHYERNTIGDHVGEMTNGQPRALAWLSGVLDGTNTASSSGCTIMNVTVGESS